MLSKLVAVLAFTAAIVTAQTTLLLPVTQDFAVANNGYSGAQVSRPDTLSFFNNGFESSVAYFGVDLSPLASYDSSTISSATLTFTNYSLSRDTSANIAITLLNYGQVFDETTVNLNTQPTSQGTLGTVTFNAAVGSATIEVMNQLKAAQTSGGLFGFRVDPPGGPVTVASHRTNPNAVYVSVVFGGTSAPTTTTTSAPVPGVPSAAATTTTAPIPGAPTVKSTTTTAGPTPANCWTCGPGWAHWYEIKGMTQPGNDPCACIALSSTTTTKAPTAGPTSAFSPSGSSSATPETNAPGVSDQPRSSANKISAALLCIVPLAIAILL